MDGHIGDDRYKVVDDVIFLGRDIHGVGIQTQEEYSEGHS